MVGGTNEQSRFINSNDNLLILCKVVAITNVECLFNSTPTKWP